MRTRTLAGTGLVHAVLLTYTVVALWPILLVISNSFKSRKAIFRDPMALPDADTFSLVGFTKVLEKSGAVESS